MQCRRVEVYLKNLLRCIIVVALGEVVGKPTDPRKDTPGVTLLHNMVSMPQRNISQHSGINAFQQWSNKRSVYRHGKSFSRRSSLRAFVFLIFCFDCSKFRKKSRTAGLEPAMVVPSQNERVSQRPPFPFFTLLYLTSFLSSSSSSKKKEKKKIFFKVVD